MCKILQKCNRKEKSHRLTYNDLTITQWVSGFIQCIQEENSDAARECMLDYLGNLMEDDFSREAAKASHAIALTNMEADHLKWTDTDKLDRIRRADAQRPVNLGQITNSRVSLLKKQNVHSSVKRSDESNSHRYKVAQRLYSMVK